MSGDAGRYLGASTRDFFAVLARPGAPVTDVGPSVLSPTPSLNPLLRRTPLPAPPTSGNPFATLPGRPRIDLLLFVHWFIIILRILNFFKFYLIPTSSFRDKTRLFEQQRLCLQQDYRSSIPWFP